MDILYFIVWSALLQGFILSLIYIFSKKRRSTANTLLGLFLLSLLLMAITAISPYNSIGKYNFKELFAIPNVLLLTPLLFFHFVLAKLGTYLRYKLFLKINYLIAFLISLITLLNVYLFVFKSSSISQTFQPLTIYWFHFFVSAYSFVIATTILFISWKETRNFKVLVQNEFSDYDLLKVNWLFNLVYFLIPVLILWGIALYRVAWVTGFSPELDFPIFVLIAVFLYYLSYQAYLNPSFFETLPESTLKEQGKISNQNTPESEDRMENGQLIKNLMLENKYYLNHNLTISDFAKEIEISPRKISTIINQVFKKNFNEWVNEFRVNKAKGLLEHDVDNKYSIEGIGEKSGFKSRSAFYAAFKNKLGCSPGEFRNSMRSKD